LDGGQVHLRALDGHLVATLTSGGHPTRGPNIAPDLASSPVLNDDLRRRLTSSPALPPGVVSATREQLLGNWVDAANPSLRGNAAFATDSSWRGSDGVNDWGGRWAAGPNGSLVLAPGAGGISVSQRPG